MTQTTATGAEKQAILFCMRPDGTGGMILATRGKDAGVLEEVHSGMPDDLIDDLPRKPGFYLWEGTIGDEDDEFTLNGAVRPATASDLAAHGLPLGTGGGYAPGRY